MRDERADVEGAVRSCYATWSGSYYDDYYGSSAAYPPIHRELILQLLRDHGAGTLLDAGCGPASFLRHALDAGIDCYGFDVTREMVDEARRVFASRGASEQHVWEGSVLEAGAFRAPGGRPDSFDATVCIGVFPHIPPGSDVTAIENLFQSLRPGGLAILEARNMLFSLFTLNRYSLRFFQDELIEVEDLLERSGDDAPALGHALEEMTKRFRTDLPVIRSGTSEEPGYDAVLSRTHNPLLLERQMRRAGFNDVRLLFYHYHALPPMLEGYVPELFRRESLEREDPEDWRGMFMASAFLLVGTRPGGDA